MKTPRENATAIRIRYPKRRVVGALASSVRLDASTNFQTHHSGHLVTENALANIRYGKADICASWIVARQHSAEKLAFVFHRVGQGPDLFDFNGDAIAWLQPTGRRSCHSDAVRCSGKDCRSRKKSSAPAEKLNKGGNIKDHVAGGPVLDRLAIHDGPNAQGVRIRNFIRRDKART